MLVFCVRIEVVGSLWWLMQDIGLGFAANFGPAPRAGPEGPWGWMLVFCVRIGCGESLVAGAGRRVRVRDRSPVAPGPKALGLDVSVLCQD